MKSRVKLRFFVSTLTVLMLGFTALPASAASGPGYADNSFDGGTPVVLDSTPSVTFQPYTAAMNPLNHDILWAGITTSASLGLSGAINVYTPVGSLDPAVGSGGEITLTADQAGVTGGQLYLYAIAVDDQGRILVAGMLVDLYGAPAMILARFNPGGTLDANFGAAGTGIVVDPLGNYAVAGGLSLTADGHILVTGGALFGGATVQLTVWRFKSDGTAETAFGDNGHVQIAAVNDSAFETCVPALQPDGALIVGCQRSAAGSWKLTRLTAAGTEDAGFGTGGVITGAANFTLGGIALAPDGGFVISESDQSALPSPVEVRRYLADGSPDSGFNNGGPLQLVAEPGSRFPVAVQPDGKILISSNGGGSNYLYISRFLANGQADSSFGTSAIDFNSIGGYDYTPYPAALLVQGDGRIVASGWADSSGGGGAAAFVTRVLSDPYALTPSALAFNAVTRAPLGQVLSSNAVDVNGVNIGGNTNGVYLALVTQNGKYGSSTGGPFAGGFTGTNVAWVPAGLPTGGTLALEQMTPTTGGTAAVTTVALGGVWAANNYEIPLGSPATASWTTTTDQPPVASDDTLSTKTGKATTGTLTATNLSSGTLAFAIVTAPTQGTVTVTAATGAYTYTSTAGYTGSDSFTWKVNDGVADSNIATVNVTVKAVPVPAPSSSGGGSLGPLGLFVLALLGFGMMLRKRRAS